MMKEVACENKTGLYEVYKCNICGNIIEVIHAGAKALVCCKEPMNYISKHLEEDEKYEKHLPVVKVNSHGINVKVGSVEHPMEEKHHIEWISVVANGKELRKFLQPGEKPAADFEIIHNTKNIVVNEYCNLHGLWTTEIEDLN